MKHFIIGWEFKNGKIIVTKEDPYRMETDGHGNYYEYYYEEECTDHYGLLRDCFEWNEGDKLTGLSYEEWIKTFDYDEFIHRFAGGQDWWDVACDLLGIITPEPVEDNSLPF